MKRSAQELTMTVLITPGMADFAGNVQAWGGWVRDWVPGLEEFPRAPAGRIG